MNGTTGADLVPLSEDSNLAVNLWTISFDDLKLIISGTQRKNQVSVYCVAGSASSLKV